MKAVIIKKTDNYLLIRWTDDSLGFGELKMTWDSDKGVHILDSEYLGIDNVIKIFKALPATCLVRD